MQNREKSRGGFTLEEMEPYLEGKKAWPHFDTIPLEQAVRSIAGVSYLVPKMIGTRLISADRLRYTPASYFLDTTQGGRFTGNAVVLYYVWENGHGTGKAGEVFMCNHKKIEGPNADHRRGWHPGFCELCGLDMTVDSGD